jgi:hypothetical protein
LQDLLEVKMMTLSKMVYAMIAAGEGVLQVEEEFRQNLSQPAGLWATKESGLDLALVRKFLRG